MVFCKSNYTSYTLQCCRMSYGRQRMTVAFTYLFNFSTYYTAMTSSFLKIIKKEFNILYFELLNVVLKLKKKKQNINKKNKI